jgi:hypothetical protein
VRAIIVSKNYWLKNKTMSKRPAVAPEPDILSQPEVAHVPSEPESEQNITVEPVEPESKQPSDILSQPGVAHVPSDVPSEIPADPVPSEPVLSEPVPKRRGRPAGSKNKPNIIETPVQQPVESQEYI